MILNRHFGKYDISISGHRIDTRGLTSIYCLPFIHIVYQPSDCSDEVWWYWCISVRIGWLMYELNFTLFKDIFN